MFLKPRILFSLPLALGLFLCGCGTSTQSSSTFSLTVLPATVVLSNGGAPQSLTVGASSSNDDTAAIQVSLMGLPSGVVASPASFTLVSGSLQQVMLSSVAATPATTPTVSLVAISAGVTETVPVSVQVLAAQTTAALSASTYHFGDNLVGNTLTRQVVSVTNTGTAALALSPTVSGDPGFAVNPTPIKGSCGTSLAPAAVCFVRVDFAPTSATPATSTAALSLGFGNVQLNTPQTVALTGTSAALTPGTVSVTANPQVALYSINLPFPGSVTVNFGLTTSYGMKTWTQTAAVAGPVNLYVAGMLPLSTYHLQATINLPNGIDVKDADLVFTTQDSLLHPQLAVATTPGAVPQPGVEELTFIEGTTDGLAVTDLAGNILWSYVPANPGTGNQIQGAKLLPNGHFLITIGQASNLALSTTDFSQGTIDSIREIDLAGNIIRQITTTDLTAELASIGDKITLEEFHHDVTALPNGHWLVLANTLQTFQSVAGVAGPVSVLGDVIIDLDTNLQPVWVWNSFDYLDVNRHPLGFPDWTHSNAVVYSPSDGNIILSVRHQNWVLKLNYANGTGDGSIVWHLGEGGDFALANGTDPTDWFYAQHYPSLFTPNSSGVFSLGLMDNGDDRVFPSGITCNSAGQPACLYTTIPVYQLDETAKTATLLFHQLLPPALYSAWGGDTEQLANGNIEYDLAGEANGGSLVTEITPNQNPQVVWQMSTFGTQAYRGYRIPSLYPGVQW